MPVAIDLLIFDLDGTLVDTRRDLARAVNHALSQLGYEEFTEETIVGFVGDGIARLIERVLHEAQSTKVDSVLSHFREYYAEHLADFSRPYSGVEQVLGYFQDKRKAVLTNKPHVFSETLLQRLQLRHYFDLTIGGQNGFELKPEPAAIYHILQELRCQPQNALMIGDSGNDILAGKAAGIHTCAVTYGFRPAEELRLLKPDFMIDSAEELIDLLDKNATPQHF